jgi:hypothetical protein
LRLVSLFRSVAHRMPGRKIHVCRRQPAACRAAER